MASLAAPVASRDMLGVAQRLGPRAAEVADVLPGASLWPQVMDMQGKVAGSFPTPLAGVIVLGMAGLMALGRAGRIKARRAKDAEIDHDEERREAVRRRHRQ